MENQPKHVMDQEQQGDSFCGHKKCHLTSEDIKRCRETLQDIIIAPFDFSKAKGVGYNLSLSEMVYSITRNRLVPICREAQNSFFYLRPNETVLALSYEYIKAENDIAGSFHSRVRITAQGIGSISTTLDPGWKGMLLFSLNNPTRKKIKVLLSTRVDGTVVPSPVITLIAWRTSPQKGEGVPEEHLTLHLDNPPMRSDIWSELTAKPLRLFRNRHYQRFCRLVEAFSSFDKEPSPAVSWAARLSHLLTKLRIAILAQESEREICAALIQIKDDKELPDEVIKCSKKLTAVLEEGADLEKCNLLKVCKKKEYLDLIDLVDREIQYQLLCDQVSQIHKKISQYVQTSWYKNKLANLWHQLLKNLGMI